MPALDEPPSPNAASHCDTGREQLMNNQARGIHNALEGCGPFSRSSTKSPTIPTMQTNAISGGGIYRLRVTIAL
jgi:hypothetical protein